VATLDDLNDVAQAFLDAATDALDLTAAGAPGRRYISPGEPALDCCGQLTVWIQTLTDADLAAGSGALSRQKAVNRGTQPEILLNIQATRCIDLTPDPATELPYPERLEDAALAMNQDGWALRCHLMDSLRHGALAQVCSGAEFLGANALIPQGGCVGWTFTFRYPIDGGIIGT
jgi:hypothetical protein